MRAQDAEKLRPPLDAAGELAIEVFSFMGGWHPERLPLAVSLYDVEDPELMIELLGEIRDEMTRQSRSS